MRSGSQRNLFLDRLDVSNWWTHEQVLYLLEIGHIVDYRKATRNEDVNDKIDYWFLYPDKLDFEPISFKLRVDFKRRDIPILRFQPYYGIDHTETKIGRDFTCVTEKSITQYYVAVKDQEEGFSEIYRISKKKLKPLLLKADKNWDSNEKGFIGVIPKKDLTFNRNLSLLNGSKRSVRLWSTDNVEVWWQKNPSEKFSKINFYLPEDLKEESFLIPDDVSEDMIKRYSEAEKTNTVNILRNYELMEV